MDSETIKAEIIRLKAKIVELESELARVTPYLAAHAGYGLYHDTESLEAMVAEVDDRTEFEKVHGLLRGGVVPNPQPEEHGYQ